MKTFELASVIADPNIIITDDLSFESVPVIADPNIIIADDQRKVIESAEQEVDGIKLVVQTITTVAEKKAKIDRNNQSIKEYEEKIIEWQQLNKQLLSDLKEIEKLGLKVD